VLGLYPMPVLRSLEAPVAALTKPVKVQAGVPLADSRVMDPETSEPTNPRPNESEQNVRLGATKHAGPSHTFWILNDAVKQPQRGTSGPAIEVAVCPAPPWPHSSLDAISATRAKFDQTRVQSEGEACSNDRAAVWHPSRVRMDSSAEINVLDFDDRRDLTLRATSKH